MRHTGLLFVFAMGSCIAESELGREVQSPQPVEGEPAAAAGPAPAVAETGGANIGAASLLTRGATVEGWTMKGKPRYYRLNIAANQKVTVQCYTRLLVHAKEATGHWPKLSVLDQHSGVLAENTVYTDANLDTGNFSAGKVEYTATKDGAVFVEVACPECVSRIHYKIIFE